ncbi:unnamed protein product, partial [Diplocarpon coronariae]
MNSLYFVIPTNLKSPSSKVAFGTHSLHSQSRVDVKDDANELAGSIPPELPPTVEEAYRRKCIELKQRLVEVEQANDAQRIRTDRARRAVQKMRLERSFLLEQLAKRTSTNVEDSEGSPSPPPT